MKTLPPLRRRRPAPGCSIEPLETRIAPAALFPEFVDPNPSAGNGFGAFIVPLNTGKVVVASPQADVGGTDTGAVYLYDGATGALISTLVGSTPGDQVGSTGITALTNGNFVVRSANWDNLGMVDAGAVTWGNGTTGVNGVVSVTNSLVGTTASDQVGLTGVTAVGNEHYVVRSAVWDNGGTVDAGAVTWGNGTTGVIGPVSAANSLVGMTASDGVGTSNVTVLTNGNYVVSSPNWDNGAATDAGAVTWGHGATGVSGAVSPVNSLVGSRPNDQVSAVTALTNGNYVVTSANWDNLAVQNVGAATWADGTIGVSGPVSAANSLLGTTPNNQVGNGGARALTNGNYVVISFNWDNGPANEAGAVTWGNGATGLIGTVSPANSLVGTTANSFVGGGGGNLVAVLPNGNYVVISSSWDDGPLTNLGAITWGDGLTGVSGPVSAANSLVGSTPEDGLNSGVTVLQNGNYVVRNQNWDNVGAIDVGAATWANGATGLSGVINAANSLIGTVAGDQVGLNGVTVLTNGNYVVRSNNWDNAVVADVGAVTWGSGVTGVNGPVSQANSLVGTTPNDFLNGLVTALTNGNFVVRSANWDNGPVMDAGAMTWGNGTTALIGEVTVANSLVGTTAGDQVGFIVTPLTNGNYVVRSQFWDNGPVLDAGAVTWGNGATGVTGPVGAGNSLVGSTANDNLGINTGGSNVTALPNGGYLVTSANWDNGPLVNAGAVTLGGGAAGVSGPVNAVNSTLGLVANAAPVAPVLDSTNANFISRFSAEGKIRVRSQDDGLAAPGGSLAPTLTGGNLTILDTAGVLNNLTVTATAGNLVITDANEQFASAPPGATLSNGFKTLTIALSAITAGFTFDGAGGDDLLTLDFSSGNVIPTGGLLFQAGAQGPLGDALILTGGTTGSVTHSFTNPNDGSVTLAGALAGTIGYTGLEPITDNLAAADRVFTFNGGAEAINLTDAAGAAMLIDSPFGKSVTFPNPANSLTINAGSGDDTINIASLDAAYTGALAILGDAATDNISLAAGLPNLAALTTNSETLGAVPALTIGAGGLNLTATGSAITQTGALNVTGLASFNAGANAITLTNAANAFGTVSIGGGSNVSLLDDGGFDLGASDASTLLSVQSAGAITQSAPLTGTGGLTKLGPGTLTLSAANAYAGTTTIAAGTLQVGNGGVSGSLGTGPVVNNAALVFDLNASVTVTNAISGPGSLTRSGSGGSVKLSATNGYTGPTSVNGARLYLTGDLTGTASVSVAASGSLVGIGTIAATAPLTINGNLSPGGENDEPPGILNTGPVTFVAGTASFDAKIDGPAPNHDQLVVTGGVTLGNATLNAFGGIASVPGQQIVLIANDSNDPIAGTFNGLLEGADVIVNGIVFKITYAGGTNNNDVVLVQPPVDTEVTLAAGDLVITDILAGGHNGTLTLQPQTAGSVYVVTDPLRNLAVTGIAGATLSADGHTVTVPFAAITGTQILVNSLGGDDTLTVDLSQGPLTKTLAFDGGVAGAPGDRLVLSGATFLAATFAFASTQSGSITMAGSPGITHTGVEMVDSSLPTLNLTLNYDASVPNTLTVTDAGGGKTTVTSTAGVALGIVNPSATLTFNGGSNADTFNLNSLSNFPGVLTIDGKAGADAVNLPGGLPALGGLTVVTETLGALPALTIGAGGLAITATGSSITQTGALSVTGTAAFTAGANAITLTNAGNNFTGAVSLSNSGANAVSITDTNALTLGVSNVGTGTLSATAGGALTVSGAIGFGGGLDLTATGANLPLSVQGTLTKAGGGNATANLKATGDVRFESSADLTVSAGALAVTLNADSDALGGGGVLLDAGSVLVTNGGDVTIGGGASPSTTPTGGLVAGIGSPPGSGGAVNYGFEFAGGADINTGAGNISIRGHGRDGVGGQNSIGGQIESTLTTTTGSITIFGTGGSGSAVAIGLALGNATIQSTNGGAISLTGVGQSPTSSGGVDFTGSVVKTTGTGTITIQGTGSPAISSSNDGIRLSSGSSVTVAGSGAIMLTGIANPAASALRLVTAGTNRIGFDSTNPYSGNIAINADSVSLANHSISTTGSVTFLPTTANTAISLGGASTLDLTDAELDGITAATVQIGNGNSGAITIGAAITHANHLALTTGAGVTFNNSVAMAADRNLTVSALGTSNGAITLANANADLSATGTGAISLTTAQGISMVTTGASITTVNGGITLEGNQQALPTAGNFYGVRLSNSVVIQATGSGDITLRGRGGVSGTFGVGISIDTSSTVSTNAGSITILGTAANGTFDAGNGVQVLQSAVVESTGGGSIDLTGFGDGTGQRSQGIRVILSGTVRTTGVGAITLTGTGSAAGAGTENYGVAINNDGLVTSTGSGPITLNGTPGANSAAFFTAVGTNRLGFNGTTPYSGAIAIRADSMSVSNAAIQTTGTVSLRQQTNGTLIDLGGADSAGVLGLTDAELDQVTAGTLQIGNSNSGALTISAALSHANHLSLTTGAGLSGSGALTLAAGKNLTVQASGAIDLTGAITVPGTTLLAAGAANNITLTNPGNDFATVGVTSGATVSLRDDGGFDLGATNASTLLSVQSAGTITQSGALTGPGGLTKLGPGILTLSGTNTYSGPTTVTSGTLLVDGTIANSASVGVATGATLGGIGTIAPAVPTTVNGFLAPGGSPGVLNTGNVTLSAAGSFNVEVNGAFPNHDRLTVTGTVALGGVNLNATGSITSVPGQQIVLIANDGNDPITGTFNGLPEGAPVTVNGVPFNVTYAGGTNNNDVVLVQPPPETEVTLAAGNLVVTDVAAGGHNGTLTLQAQSAGSLFVITDPNRLLTATGIPGAIVSPDMHTVSVPFAAVTGPQILVNSLAGDDTLTVDLSTGPLTKTLSFDGGAQATTDMLFLTGPAVTAATFAFASTQSGSITLAGSPGITHTGVEMVDSSVPTTNLTLNYDASVANTITVTDAGGGKTTVTSTAGVALGIVNPSATLTFNGGSNADTFNLNSLSAFAGALTINGQAGTDAVTLAAGLPALAGLTVVTETLGALPALSIGAGGLAITATASSITQTGALSVTGTASFTAGANAITLTNAANAFGTVSIGSGDTVSLRDDSGFNLGAANVATLLSVESAGTITQSAPITGAGGLQKNGTGTLILSASNTYNGATTINFGTLQLGAAAVIPDGVGNGDLSLSPGTSFDLNGFSETINGLSGSGTVINSAVTAATLTVGNNNATSAFAGAITGQVALTKIGAGTLTLSNTGNSYTGGTAINGGTLTLGAAGVLPDAGTVVVNAAILDLNGFSETVGGFTLMGGGSLLGGGGTLQSGTAFDLRQGSVSAALTGNVGVIVSGGGNVTFNTAATYTGATEIRDGVITLNGGANRLPVGTNLILGAAPATSGILDLNNSSQEVAGLTTAGAGVNNQVIDSTADAVIPVLTVNLPGATNTFGGILGGGPISNGFALAKTGTGTLVLTGTNSYSGGTQITTGTLQIGSSSPTGTLGSGPVVNNAALAFNRSAGLTVANAISGTGSLAQSGSGPVTLSATNTYTGPTTVITGTLLVTGSLADGPAATDVTVSVGATLGGTGTIGGAVSNSGTVQPGGSGAAGTLTITGAYTQNAGGTLAAEIGGTNPGTQYDVLSVGGPATLAGTLAVSFLSGFTPVLGDTFNVVTGASRSGTFGTVTGAGLLTTNYTATQAQLVRAAAIFTWDGSASSDWFTGANWDANAVPTAGDTAILNIASTINLSASTSVATFQQSAGTLTSPGGVTFTVLQSFTWSGGTQSGAGATTVAPGATLNLATGGVKSLLQRTLNLAGNTTVTSTDNLLLDNAAVLNNSGLFDFQTDADINSGAGGGTFNNLPGGTVRKSAGAAISFLDPTFNNSSLVEAQTGTLRIGAGGGGNGPSFVSSPGATIIFNAGTYAATGATSLSGGGLFSVSGGLTLAAGSSVTGAGTVLRSLSLLTVNGATTFGPGTLLDLQSGTLSGTGTLTIEGGLTWSGGTMSGAGTTTVNAGASLALSGTGGKTLSRPLINNGTTDWSGGAIAGTGAWTNNGVFNASAGATFSPTFTNAASGTFNQAAGSNTFSAAFTNAGAVNANAGAAQFNAVFTQTAGTTSLAGGNLGSAFAFAFQGGTLSGTGTITGDVNNTGATVRPGGTGVAGTLTVTGTYTQGAGGTLAAELGGTGVGQFDVLAVGGNATLGGTLNLANLAGFTPVAGNQFRIVTSPNNPGAFATLTGAITGITQQPDATGLVLQANALVYVWDNSAGNGDWFNALNWNLDSGVPGVGDTAVLSIASTINLAASTSVGTFQQSNGDFTSGAGVTFTVVNSFNWTGGVQSGAGTTTLASGATWTMSGGDHTLSRAVINGGTANWTVGAILVGAGGSIVNNGLFNSSAGAALNAPFTNAATGIFTHSAGTTTANAAFDNAGTVNVTGGTLALNAGGTSTGIFNVGATLRFTGGTHLLNSADFAGAGTVDFAGGAQTLDAASTYSVASLLVSGATTTFNIGALSTVQNLTQSGGLLTGSGNLRVTGSFVFSGGEQAGAGTTTVAGGATWTLGGAGSRTVSRPIVNDGTATWSGTGSILANAGGSMVNNSVFNSSAGAGLNAPFTNAATGIFTHSAGITTASAAFNNAGTVNVTGGTLALNGGGTSTGIFNVGATLRFTGGTHLLNSADFAGAGTVDFAGGAQTLDSTSTCTVASLLMSGATTTFNNGTLLTVPNLTQSGGLLNGSGNLRVTGAFVFSGGEQAGAGTTTVTGGATWTLGGGGSRTVSRPIVNDGTATWNGTGSILANAGGSIVNNSVFNSSAGAALNAPFTNAATGTFTHSAGTTTASAAFTNAGTVSVTGGALNLTGSFTQTGGATVLAGGSITGGITLDFNGGELRGAGSIAGAVNNSGATVRPGGTAAAGTLAITGSFTQGAGGTLAAELGGTGAGQFDALNVTGAATLGGTLSLTDLAGFSSLPGQTFQIVANDAADPISGTFNGLAEGAAATISGIAFNITYAGGSNNNDVVLAQALFDTEVTLNVAGDLVIADATAGGHDDTLTITSAPGGLQFTITDPNRIFTAPLVPGAVLSADLHSVTVPTATVSGAQIIINALAGDDVLTVDFSQGNFSKSIQYDAGAQGAVGDQLALIGATFASAVFNFTGAGSGGVTLPGNGAIAYTGLEAVNSTLASASLTLNYAAAAAKTITVTGAGAGKTLVTSTADATINLVSPSTALTIRGAGGADTINVNSLDPSFAATLAIDGVDGADLVTLAAGLPPLAGLTVKTANLGPLPALSIGAGGLEITTTAGDIAVGGNITATGNIGLHSAAAITNSAGAIGPATLVADAVNGITLALNGTTVSATNTGAGGITLNSADPLNPVRIIALDAGVRTIGLNGNSFLLTKSETIADTSSLSVGGTFNLNGFSETIAGLSGAGTITNTAAVLSILTVGANDGGGTFSGNLQNPALSPLALTKIGSGTLILSGASNTYTGGTTITSGTLQFDAKGSALDGAFNLGGGTLLYDLPLAADTLGAAINFTEPSSIGVAAGKQITLTGVLSGRGGLTKTGAGTLVLGNSLNSFGPAPLNIVGGTLRVASDGALGDIDNDVFITNATFAASASFISARNFVNAGGTATIDVTAATLTLINKETIRTNAIIPPALTPTIPGNLLFKIAYADGPGTVFTGTTAPFPDGTVLTFGGPGQAIVHVDGLGNIEAIELSGTNTASKLIVKGPATDVTTIKRIFIDDFAASTIASIGSVVIGKNVRLGDEVRDSVPELYVEGKSGKLQLDDLNRYALIDLGEGLPYNVATDKKTPDTYNHQPDLKIHNILGEGVIIDLTPSDLPLDGGGNFVGGGGLGKVVVNDWHHAGAIRTTQSIRSFKLSNFDPNPNNPTHSTGDFLGVFQVDKFGAGVGTTANVGSMRLDRAGWGSSGSEIEGNCGLFEADEFLEGATLTAASMGKFTLDAGAFAGFLRLTRVDPDAPGLKTFTVKTDFSGSVVSGTPLRKIKVNGDFLGDLEAPFIGSITAYSFFDPDPAIIHEIAATDGSLGTLTTTGGVISNFSIVTDQAFKGFNVKLSKLDTDTVGIDHVFVEALSIGNISVSLAAAPGAAIDLVGILDSDFIATGTGTTKDTLGSIGKISVTLGGSASSVATTGISGLYLSAGANVGAITVKSKVLAHGTIEDSTILAGQALDVTSGTKPELLARLAKATLGPVNASGSIDNTALVAGGSIGAVTAGGGLTDSLILAGALLGSDGALGGSGATGDSYQRAASIAAITVKGTFARTSILAGVDPVNGIFGDADDSLAAVAGILPDSSKIGPISLPLGALANNSGTSPFAFVIEAAKLASLKLGPAAPVVITTPRLLDLPPGPDADDVIVRLVT